MEINFTLLDVANLDEQLRAFVNKDKAKTRTELIKKYLPEKLSLYKKFRNLANYYYRNSIVPKEEEWQTCLNYYSNLVYVMAQNNVVDKNRMTELIKQLKELPQDYDKEFKKKCKNKIKDKAPDYFLKFVVMAPGIINAINNSPADSQLREDLLKQLPAVGSDSFLIAPSKLWLTLSIILSEIIVKIKMWATNKVMEAEEEEKRKIQKK